MIKQRVNRLYHWASDNPGSAVFTSFGASVVVTVAVSVGLGLYSSATYVQKTDCSKDPTGAKCAALRLEIAKGEPIKNPCASYQRVTDRRGRNCKHFFVPHGKATSSSPAPDSQVTSTKGTADTDSTTTQGGSPTGDGPPAHQEGHHGGHQEGEHPSPDVPGAGGGDGPPSESSPAPTGASESAPEEVVAPPTEETTPPDDHPIRTGVEHTLEGVGDTVDGAQCKLLNRC